MRRFWDSVLTVRRTDNTETFVMLNPYHGCLPTRSVSISRGRSMCGWSSSPWWPVLSHLSLIAACQSNRPLLTPATQTAAHSSHTDCCCCWYSFHHLIVPLNAQDSHKPETAPDVQTSQSKHEKKQIRTKKLDQNCIKYLHCFSKKAHLWLAITLTHMNGFWYFWQKYHWWSRQSKATLLCHLK